MFGRHWEKARGTIVTSHTLKTSGDGSVTIHEFVVDVRTNSGTTFRAKLEEPRIATDFLPPSNGTEIDVLYDEKSGKVKFDKDDPAISMKAFHRRMTDNFDAVLTQQPGTPPPSPTGSPYVQGMLQSWQNRPVQGVPWVAQGSEGSGPAVVYLRADDPNSAAVRHQVLQALGLETPPTG